MNATNLLSSKRFDRSVLSLIIVMFASTSLTFGQDQSPIKPASRAAGTEIHTYDVSEFVHAGRNHPYASTIVRPTEIMAAEGTVVVHSGGGGGQGGQGLFGGGPNQVQEEQRTNDEIAGDVITLIQEGIEPESWRANGGVIGNITYLSGKIVIRHTPQVHEQIRTLLTELRPTSVTLRAKWVRLDDARLATLFQGAERGTGRAVQPKAWSSLLAAEPSIVIHEGETTCFSGQTVHLAAGHGKMFSVDSESVVGNDAVGYNVMTRMVNIGAILQLSSMVNTQTKTAVVELWSEVSEDHTKPTEPLAIKVAGIRGEAVHSDVQTPTIDRLDLAIQHFGTTLKVPLNTPVIVAGMTMPGAEGGEKPTAPLYLVLEVIAGD